MKKKSAIASAAVYGALLLLYACTESDEALSLVDELKEQGLDRYMYIEPAKTETINADGGTWTEYTFSTDDCINFTGDPYVMRIRDEGSKNTIVYMQGGGARWPGGGRIIENTIDGDWGWMDPANPDNPMKDWNVVYIPYRDASVHSGDNYVDYGEEGWRYHWGFRNLSASIAAMKAQFPECERIFLSGQSAGGFGTFLAWGVIKIQYPEAKTYIFNDAGPGLWDPSPEGVETFTLIRETWNIDQFLPDSCTECDEQLGYLYKWYMKRDPQLRIGQFSGYYDGTISGIFLQISGKEYKELLLETTGTIKQDFPDRYARFFIDDACHTTNLCSGAGKGLDYEINGTSVFEWLGGLISDGDKNWDDLME